MKKIVYLLINQLYKVNYGFNFFLSFFNAIEDHRIDRKTLHPLINIISIATGAVICKAESWEDIHQFGLAKKE